MDSFSLFSHVHPKFPWFNNSITLKRKHQETSYPNKRMKSNETDYSLHVTPDTSAIPTTNRVTPMYTYSNGWFRDSTPRKRKRNRRKNKNRHIHGNLENARPDGK